MNDLLYTQRLHGRLRWFHFNSGERKLPSENLTAAEQFCKVKKGALRPWKKQLQAKDYDSHFAPFRAPTILFPSDMQLYALCADFHYVSLERSCSVPLGKTRRTVVPFPSVENREIPSPILSHSRLLR